MKKNNINIWVLPLLLSLFPLFMQAQRSTNAAGGDGTGTGGSLSFTFGQVLYTSFTSSSGAVEQGVQQVFCDPLVTGIIDSTGELICYGGTPSVLIGSLSNGSGGDGIILYSWRSSADNYQSDIDGATMATFMPPAGLTQTTGYRRYVRDESCSPMPELSMGTWTVTVSPAPVLLCPGPLMPVTSNDGPGDCNATASWMHPTDTAGSCEPLTLTMSLNGQTPEAVVVGASFTQVFEVGIHTITYAITDGGDNIAACSFTVTVIDDEAPVQVCAGSVELRFSGESSLPLPLAELALVSDNCGEVTTSLHPSSVTISQLGQLVPVQVQSADESGNTSVCSTEVMVLGLPEGWSHNSGSVGDCGSSVDYTPATGVWTAASTNCRNSSPFESDRLVFAQRSLCGDGSITARVSGLSGGQAFAGISMRESNAAGARKVQLMINRVSNIVRREIRTTIGGQAFPMDFSSPSSRTWLRIERTGNMFRGYTSMDGITWWYVMQVWVPMDNCIEVGLVMSNQETNVASVGSFDQVTVTGAHQGVTLLRPGYAVSHADGGHIHVAAYPNPTQEVLNVKLSHDGGLPIGYRLYDVQGKQQLGGRIAGGQVEIDLRSLVPGTYSLQIHHAENPIRTIQFLKL